ncbi:hypothetical protein Cgig2_014729 [Carnegiea gigantea]|uniref:Phytocyanin domain-containing protein n=1 Tax=Carnegiea gigantea TaxID=171969 RepID=A0A9Q1KY48_9CARY|nr:hypothetical protein Cgig2_014729 [Carnegiea gigantea]
MYQSKSYCRNVLLKFIVCYGLIILCCHSKLANSEAVTVGGDNRWSDGFDFISWAQSFNFTVGDVLVFSYTKGTHNVYDVSKAAYQSCDTSNGVNAKYDSGSDRVELTEARQYWFICTVNSHCKLGMKFGINVADTGASATSNTTSTTASFNPDQGNSASATHTTSSGFYGLLVLAAWNLLQS